jgi:Xaa-Pro dipeptidase
VAAACEHALEQSAAAGSPFDGILFHSGAARTYHAQDREIPFQPVPHFARLAPLAAPDQWVVLRPGTRPRLVRVVPLGFWTEPAAEPEHPWREAYDVIEVASRDEACAELGALSRFAYVGDDPALAERVGMPAHAIEPQPLVSVLDWHRGEKTRYEVECIREAARVAALGHAAARNCADDRGSERQIHAAYLAESGLREAETPYTNIIAWDDASAVLHYGRKRSSSPHPAATFLIDAGATHLGYASDVTRSYAYASAHPLFVAALRETERLQRELVREIRPGLPYTELHQQAVRGVCAILSELGLLRVDADTALASGLAYPFFPHGVGHHLGLQVHDVGGQQTDPTGGVAPPPPQFPYLRTTRQLEPGQVVTVEPGLYFIPLLLDPHRAGPHRDAFDWGKIDALVPCGGIRIEDDVLVTADGQEDLTRPFIPGSSG